MSTTGNDVIHTLKRKAHSFCRGRCCRRTLINFFTVMTSYLDVMDSHQQKDPAQGKDGGVVAMTCVCGCRVTLARKVICTLLGEGGGVAMAGTVVRGWHWRAGGVTATRLVTVRWVARFGGDGGVFPLRCELVHTSLFLAL